LGIWRYDSIALAAAVDYGFGGFASFSDYLGSAKKKEVKSRKNRFVSLHASLRWDVPEKVRLSTSSICDSNKD
jgi:hypothetical protein